MVGALAGNRSERALETRGWVAGDQVNMQHPTRRVFNYGLNVYQGVSENFRRCGFKVTMLIFLRVNGQSCPDSGGRVFWIITSP